MGLASAVCLGQPIARFAGDVLLIVYAWVPLAAICCLLLVAVLHQVLRACCRNAYGTRPVAEQVVTCLHAAQALQFAAMAAPMTIYTAQLVWGTFVEVYTDYFIPCFIMFSKSCGRWDLLAKLGTGAWACRWVEAAAAHLLLPWRVCTRLRPSSLWCRLAASTVHHRGRRSCSCQEVRAHELSLHHSCFSRKRKACTNCIAHRKARTVPRRNLLLVTHHTVSFLITTIGEPQLAAALAGVADSMRLGGLSCLQCSLIQLLLSLVAGAP